jgi:hypothetical protein
MTAPSHPLDSFLDATTTRAMERAGHLCRSAVRVVAQAKAQVAECRRLRTERESWRLIWSASRQQPGLFIMCCAFCARIRSSRGAWVSVPIGVSDALHRARGVLLSHGYCSDCIARHFPD